MDRPIVTVFGGTGFLGRRVVRRLRDHAFRVRIASRHPQRARGLFGLDDPELQAVEADIDDEASIAAALRGAHGAVNAVSLYVERGGATFHSVHVEGARRLAAQAKQARVERLVHVSGVGSDAGSPSLYIRKRGEGELAVRAEFADAIVVRPAVMFGPDDALLGAILRVLRRLPAFPLFGDGRTKLQPAYVGDVAEALARSLQRPGLRTLECGGPRVYAYRSLVGAVAGAAGLERPLVPVPFGVWRAMAWLSERLPNPPLTRNQVELMQVDNVASPESPGFAELGISPRSVETILERMLAGAPEPGP
jgi:NADH dehydrogenase